MPEVTVIECEFSSVPVTVELPLVAKALLDSKTFQASGWFADIQLDKLAVYNLVVSTGIRREPQAFFVAAVVLSVKMLGAGSIRCRGDPTIGMRRALSRRLAC